MNLKPTEYWSKNERGIGDARRFAENQLNRNLISDCLLDYCMRRSKQVDGALLIRGAVEFVEELLTVGEPQPKVRPPAFGLPVEERSYATTTANQATETKSK